MAFSLSPSVDIVENNISLSIPNLPSAKTGAVIRSDVGPANKILPITSEADLVYWFGKPTAANYIDWYNAWNFLQYASSLYAVRPMNADVKNAGCGLTGDANRVSVSQSNLYNTDVAELTLQDPTQMIGDRLYFFNRSITSNQNIGVAVCSSEAFWNAPIANEFFGIVTMDATTAGVGPVNLNKIGGNNLSLGEIELYGQISLVAGSQFIANNGKMFTVKNVYSNKVLVNAPVTLGDLALNYGTILNDVLQIDVNSNTFLVDFDPSKPFSIEPNAVFQFDTAVTGGAVTILAAVKEVNGTTVTFKNIAKYDTNIAPTKFDVLAGPVNSNSEYHYFTPSADYFVPADVLAVPPTVDSFEIPAGTTTIKVEAGFNYPVGASLGLVNNGGVYTSVLDDTFPNDAPTTDTDVYQIIAIDELNNTITLDQPLKAAINVPISYVLDDVVTIATALRGVNLYGTVYDQSVIVTTPTTVTDAATGANMTIQAQSLVTFSKMLDYEPNWVADEFLTVVLQKNASGLYAIKENFLASYRSTARDVQNRNLFANEVFYYNSSLVYCKVNEDLSMPKVNTAEMSLVKFVNDFGQEVNGTFVYGTVYPLKKDANGPIADALGNYAYDANAYTKGDIQNAQQTFADAEVFDVNILIAHALDINGMSEIAETRKDCIAVVAPYDFVTMVGKTPTAATMAVLEGFGAQTPSNNKVYNVFGTYSAVYGNMKYQYDKFNDVNRWMSVAGDIAGLYAQTDANRDPWWAPAGLDRGKIKNVIKLAFNPNKQNRDELYVNSVNPIITIVGEGAGIVYGQKTATSRPSAIDRINVRRLLIVVEKAIATAVKSALFEFNDSFTRSRLIGIIEPFLRTVKSRRGLYDYLVVCDESNNPGSVVDANALVIDVYVKPTKVAEFITINMNITRSDANFQELVGKSA